jgi:dihydrofolate synthase/folylpolyglutamate synthase
MGDIETLLAGCDTLMATYDFFGSVLWVSPVVSSDKSKTEDLSYSDAVAYLQGLGPTIEKPGLMRMQAYFSMFQSALRFIHVGGTNGKGSVSTFCAAILHKAGYRVGKFTGPHLSVFNERFAVDDEIISDQEFARALAVVKARNEEFQSLGEGSQLGGLSWFEVLTAMAAFYFGENTAVQVFEVGLGGRFDATNALDGALVSVVCNVDLDHVHILGDTVEKIAFEKAGIVKSGLPLVTACSDQAFPVLEKRAGGLDSPLVWLKRNKVNGQESLQLPILFRTELLDPLQLEGLTFLAEHLTELSGADLGLSGAYQRINAACAVYATWLFMLSPDSAPAGSQSLTRLDFERLWQCTLIGLREARWPGRFQLLDRGFSAILDGAHNRLGARALRASLEEAYTNKNFLFIFACFENKDYQNILRELIAPGDIVFCPVLSHARSMRSAQEIVDFASSLGAQARACHGFAEALQFAQAKAQELPLSLSRGFADRLIITGSFSLIKEALEFSEGVK